jgi:uncharacterized protein (DUF1697 family)
MPTYVALLRGINLSGQKLIKMADLRSHFDSFGAKQARTYIQSGNVIFEHRARSAGTLRSNLEKHLANKLGYAVATFVLSSKELVSIAEANPFDTGQPEFGRRMYVCFFEKPPPPAAIGTIRPLINEKERLVVKGGAGYALYADGLGGATLSSTVIERKLGTATLRNWNTVTALLEIAQSGSGATIS